MDIDIYFFAKFLLIPVVIGLIFHYIFILIAKKKRLLDRPWKFGYKRDPIPYSSGIPLSIGLIVFLGGMYYRTPDLKFLAIGLAVFLLLISNVIDDYGNTLERWKSQISTISRFLMQILASLIVIYAGISIDIISNPLGEGIIDLTVYTINIGGFVFPYVSILLTIFWITAITNIVNFTDGIRAETLGISLITLLVFIALTLSLFGIYDFSSPQWLENLTTFKILLVAFGFILANFIFEFPPAKSLIGDTGAVFCGFIIAILAIMSSAKVATAVLVLGFPILDMINNSIRRIRKGKMPWNGDLEHTHHKLLRAGFNERKALIIIFGFTIVFGITALFFVKWVKIIIILILIITMLILWKYLDYKEKNRA